MFLTVEKLLILSNTLVICFLVRFAFNCVHKEPKDNTLLPK